MEDIIKSLDIMRGIKSRHKKTRLHENADNKALMKDLESSFVSSVYNLADFGDFNLDTQRKRVEWNGSVKIDKDIYWQIVFEDGQSKVFVNFDDRDKSEIKNTSIPIHTTPIKLSRENLEFLMAIYNFTDTVFKNKVEKEM